MSTYEISKSSLLSLKAEVLKKQEEIHKSKLEGKQHNTTQPKKVTLKTNKNVEKRRENDFEEEANMLQKSREGLERKTKLYNKLLHSKSNQSESSQRYLVNFDKKSSDSSETIPDFSNEPDDVDKHPESDEDFSNNYNDEDDDDENKWVDYVDYLGRTRSCLQKDLKQMKAQDSKLNDSSGLKKPGKPPNNDISNNKEYYDNNRNSESNNKDRSDDNTNEEMEETKETTKKFSESSEMLSADMRMELLRQQWEKDEERLSKKDNIHYEDVLFSEARSHGVGYFAFSKDEEERAKQQSELKKRHEETTREQLRSQQLKRARERQLKARLRAAKNRKLIRMGLPPVDDDNADDDDEDPVTVLTPPPPLVEKTEEEQLEEKRRELLRQSHVRPWDEGKEGVRVSREEHYEMTQEEWVDKKRKERVQEFAPPPTTTMTMTSEDKKGLYFSSSKRQRNNNDNNSNGGSHGSYKPDGGDANKRLRNVKGDVYNNPFKSDSRRVNNINYSVASGDSCDNIRYFDNSSHGNSSQSVNKRPDNNSDVSYNAGDSGSHVNPYKQTTVDGEVSSEDISDSDSSEDRLMADFRSIKTVEKEVPTSSKVNVEDSIMMGLQYLRQKAETKK